MTVTFFAFMLFFVLLPYETHIFLVESQNLGYE